MQHQNWTDEFLGSSLLLISPTDKTWACFPSTKLTLHARPTVIEISLLWNFFRAPVGNTSTQGRSFFSWSDSSLQRLFSSQTNQFPHNSCGAPPHSLILMRGKKRFLSLKTLITGLKAISVNGQRQQNAVINGGSSTSSSPKKTCTCLIVHRKANYQSL